MEYNREVTQVLSAIKEAGGPVGATYLATVLPIPPATIGRMMQKLEQEGMLIKVSNKGRQLTDQGAAYLAAHEQREEKLHTANKLIHMVEGSSQTQLLEVLEIRRFLEGRSAELAAQNATPEQIKELDNIMLEYLVEMRHDGLGNEQNLRLHLNVAKISGNRTIYQILNLLLTNENAYTKFSSASMLDIKHEQLEHHENIVSAIKNHDGKGAKLAMERHIDQVISDILNYWPQGSQNREHEEETKKTQ